MPGIFDSPEQQALIALGLGLMGNEGPAGPSIYRAGTGAMDTLQRARQLAEAARMHQAQLDEMRQQARVREMQLAEMQDKAKDMARTREFWANPANYINPPTAKPQMGPSQYMTPDEKAALPMPDLQFPASVMSPRQIGARMIASGSPALAQEGVQLATKGATPMTVAKGAAIGSVDESGQFTPSYVNADAPEPTEFSRLMAERDKWPPGSANWKLFDARLNTMASHTPPVNVSVSNFEPASVAAQKDFVAAASKKYEQYSEAPSVLQNIEKAKGLVKQAGGFVGAGGEMKLQAVKFLNNNLGTNVDPTAVASAEELRSRLFFQILDNLKKMDAQPSQQQQKIMQEALGNLGSDPNAIPRILDAFGDAIRSKVSIHNKTVSDAIKRGVQFPFDPRIDLGETTKPTATIRYQRNPQTGVLEQVP